jgi:hypothetical protein
VKTTARAPVTPQDIETRRRGGGQPGNRNALKTGRHTKKLRTMRSEIAHWRHTINVLIRQGKEELARREEYSRG